MFFLNQVYIPHFPFYLLVSLAIVLVRWFLSTRAVSIFTNADSQINSVFERITGDVNRLNQDLTFWQGDSRGTSDILADSQSLINDLDTATKIIGGTTAIGNVDFLRILGEINTLNNAVDGYTKNLIQKKPQIDATPNLTGQILSSLRQQRQRADVLSKAINNKMPAIPAVVGPWIADQITQKLDAALKVYGTFNPFPNQPYRDEPYRTEPYQNQPYQGQPYQNQPYQNQPPPGWRPTKKN